MPCTGIAVQFRSEPLKLDRFGFEFSASLPFGWEERKTITASRFSEAQNAFTLKQGADGIPVAENCRRAAISQATYSTGRSAGDSGAPMAWKAPGMTWPSAMPMTMHKATHRVRSRSKVDIGASILLRALGGAFERTDLLDPLR